MKNADKVLREKELQLEAIRREVEALRMVAPLLIDEAETMPKKPLLQFDEAETMPKKPPQFDEAETMPKKPPQPEHATSDLDGTFGSPVNVKFWPY